MLRRTVAALLGIAVVVPLGLVGCSTVPGTGPAPTPTSTSPSTDATARVGPSGDGVLRIGTLFPMTGDAAGSGAAQVARAQLAAREIAEQSGARGLLLDVIHRNSAGDLVAALADLAARGVDVLVWDVTRPLPADVASSARSSGMAVISLNDLVNGGTALAASGDFGVRLVSADPGLTNTAGGAEAYDAVMVSALAAIVSADDGGASVAAGLRQVASGDVECASWEECLGVLADDQQISYGGASGTLTALTQ